MSLDERKSKLTRYKQLSRIYQYLEAL